MRVPIRIILLLCVASSIAKADEKPAQILAFIGEYVSIAEQPDPCEEKNKIQDSDTICLSMDAIYEANYRILEALHGHYNSNEITFRLADHYGFPDFANFKNALLFVFIDKKGNYLSKYQGYPVFPTTDGGWAVCGIADRYKDKYDLNKSKDIKFRSDVVFGNSSIYTSDYISENFNSELYEVVGDKVKCKTPVPVRDYYELVKNGVLNARGIKFN